MEFEWKNFPGFTTLGILDEIQKMMTELQCEPEQFKARIFFMSMYNDIVWGERGNTERCENNSQTEEKWYGTYSDKPDGDWDRTTERMMLNFCRKRPPYISRHKRPGNRRIKKQRRWKEVHSIQRL